MAIENKKASDNGRFVREWDRVIAKSLPVYRDGKQTKRVVKVE